MSLTISPKDYLKYSSLYKRTQNFTVLKELEKDVFLDIIKIPNANFYETSDGKVINLPSPKDMMDGTIFYSIAPNIEDINVQYDTNITVEESDSIDAGKKLLDAGFNPIVLNMASGKRPGGGVLNGSSAQEESLFRRTNLFQSMYQFCDYGSTYGVPKRIESYPMYKNTNGIYTPKATVFRSDKSLGYALLDEPFLLSFVSVPAINRPTLTEDGLLNLEDIQTTISKMKTIFNIAIANNHDAIVLGAWGCGAFKNPPHHIAKLFNMVLHHNEFNGKFRKVVFAIIENKHKSGPTNPNGNLLPFKTEFCC